MWAHSSAGDCPKALPVILMLLFQAKAYLLSTLLCIIQSKENNFLRKFVLAFFFPSGNHCVSTITLTSLFLINPLESLWQNYRIFLNQHCSSAESRSCSSSGNLQARERGKSKTSLRQSFGNCCTAVISFLPVFPGPSVSIILLIP